jgi:primosomal protein N' (replication factor Y)
VTTRRKVKAATPTLFPLEEPEPATAPRSVPGGYCDVALNKPMRCEYTYAVPAELRGRVLPGTRVAVPFGSGREVGVVVALRDRCDVPPRRLKPVLRLLDAEQVVGEDMLRLTEWMAARYACSWGEALAAILPAPLKRESGRRKVLLAQAAPGAGEADLVELETANAKQHRLLRTLIEIGAPVEARDVLRRLNLSESPLRTLARKGLVLLSYVEAQLDELQSARAERPRHERLTGAQACAVDAIAASVEARDGATFLLHGVTGSGKTEVYLRAIEKALELGRSAIVLVPEIALTPQTVGWFRSRFGDVCVLHSRMTDVQRLETWRRAHRGEARVVVGARSAIFAPVVDLGVVVLDEEHEPSFKQGNVPRYHARDVAVERARQAGAACVLGSATPSMETWHRARTGRYRLLTLAERIGTAGLPPVDVVDMRTEGKGRPLFSKRLLFLLGEALSEGEQAILFLNRRGFTPILWCPGCYVTIRCPSCAMALTYHRRIKRLVCHGCCEERPIPRGCPTCSRPGLIPYGAGAERVESELKRLLPDARVRRMDSDTMRRREDYEETLGAFGQREIDVLVGTQMIAKGLDFPNVTVVGIVSPDQGLDLPDFRARERTFQLIAQVAGRAGRGERPGRIVVQTERPDDAAIRLAARHDFLGFAVFEDGERRRERQPPYARLIRVLFEDEDEARAAATAVRFGDAVCAATGPDVEILGPGPAAIELLRGRHRHNMLVRAPVDSVGIERAKEVLIELAASTSRTHVAIDVDPVSMF